MPSPYVTVVYGALAVLYIDVVNIAETSLHMHLLLELAWSGATLVADLLERYSADRMIAARLERLTSESSARCRRALLRRQPIDFVTLAGAVDAWRVVLGLPDTARRHRPSVAVGHSGR